jgi:hypothetical protein
MTYPQLPTNFSDKTDQEILASMHEVTFDSDHYKHCVTVLQVRAFDRTARATARLVWATWGLVVATVLLLASTLLDLLRGNV